MIYLTLFWEFFKTGLFAVGGGLAAIPFLSDMADRYPWFTHAELTDMIAVSESTPGPIGINCATYAGYNAAGVPGALVASFSIVLPSFMLILAIASALERYRANLFVSSAFNGLRPAATGLIAAAAWSVIAIVLFNFAAFAAGDILSVIHVPGLILFAVLLLVSNIKPMKGWHPVVFIAAAAAVGILFQL